MLQLSGSGSYYTRNKIFADRLKLAHAGILPTTDLGKS